MDIITLLITWIVAALAVALTGALLPGVRVRGFGTSLLAAAVLGLVNAFIEPLIQLFALPITILTFGLFALIINGLMILLVSAIVPGFEVRNIGWAILFSIVLSLVLYILSLIL